jgi:hypothetical protein
MSKNEGMHLEPLIATLALQIRTLFMVLRSSSDQTNLEN